MPRHLAIIMDGNGRWAQARGMKRLDGHRAGAETVRDITRACRKLGIEYLTLYAFSTENWQRPRLEVEGLMLLLRNYLQNELDEMLKNGIRLRTLGDTGRLPRAVKSLLTETIAKTADNSEMVLSLALSYGGRSEIVNACRDLAGECIKGNLKPEDIDEEAFSRRLFTADMPDPDLLVRTGGDKRISNFLLWQIAYAELYITNKAWPDFKEDELKKALLDYQNRQRRFGKTGEQILGIEKEND